MSRPKLILLVPDGAADEPLAELGGRTPLAAARTPNLDALAAAGTVGCVETIPAGMTPGSDVANLAVLGYEPEKVYTGRAPLEAASIGIDLGPGDVAYRCNTVTIADGVMRDFTAGHIADADGRALMALLNERLAEPGIEFHPGVGYRNLMVWRGGRGDVATTPPHDILDQPVAGHLPRGAGEAPLRALMARAHELLTEDGVPRRASATDIWLWGQGRRPSLPLFRDLYGLDGACVAAADLIKGISRCAGFAVPAVPGATAFIDTDYAAKGRAAIALLDEVDFVFVHVEAPDEAGHMGNAVEKVKAIERIDADVLGPILRCTHDPWVLVAPDHPTPVRLRTHVAWPVPYVFGRGSAAAGAADAAPAAALPEPTGPDARALPSGRELMLRFLAAAGVAGGATPGSR